MNISKSTKFFFSTVAVCVVIAFTNITSAVASGDDIAFDMPQEHKENKHKMKRMVKALLLSEEQQVQIKAIKRQAREQHQMVSSSIKEFKAAEKELLQAEALDEQAFSALHETYQPVFAQLALLKVKTKHAIFNVLTTDQQEKWLKIVRHHKGKAKKGRG